MSTRVIQVTNISTSVTREQLRALFSNLGRIDDLQLYPESETLAATIAAKVGYVKFSSSETAQAGLNLTSTVFIDRPILCSLVRPISSSSARIPDESDALKLCAPLNTNIVLLPSGPTWPHNVVNRKVTVPSVGDQPSATYIETLDNNLTDRSLPSYPPLPGTIDLIKAEEIRRTVFVSNLDPRVTFQDLYDLFSQVGEIKYIRLTKSINDVEYESLGTEVKIPEGTDPETDFVGAYIEFSEQPSVVKALCYNGSKLNEREIKVNHSMNSVIIPANNKEQVSYENLKKSKKSSSQRESQKEESRHRSHKHRNRHDKHRGSASDSSSRSSSEDSVSSGESSPPRKQRRSTRSRSHSKSKTKSSSKSKRSRSREKDRKEKDKERDREKDREREKDKDKDKDKEKDKDRERDKEKDRDREKRRSNSTTRSSSSKKKKDDKDRDREKERSSSHKKEKRRSRDRSKDRSS